MQVGYFSMQGCWFGLVIGWFKKVMWWFKLVQHMIQFRAKPAHDSTFIYFYFSFLCWWLTTEAHLMNISWLLNTHAQVFALHNIQSYLIWSRLDQINMTQHIITWWMSWCLIILSFEQLLHCTKLFFSLNSHHISINHFICSFMRQRHSSNA